MLKVTIEARGDKHRIDDAMIRRINDKLGRAFSRGGGRKAFFDHAGLSPLEMFHAKPFAKKDRSGRLFIDIDSLEKMLRKLSGLKGRAWTQDLMPKKQNAVAPYEQGPQSHAKEKLNQANPDNPWDKKIPRPPRKRKDEDELDHDWKRSRSQRAAHRDEQYRSRLKLDPKRYKKGSNR